MEEKRKVSLNGGRPSIQNSTRKKPVHNLKEILKKKPKRTFEEELERYSRNSLFILSKRKKFRLFFIKLVQHLWFERFIMFAIFASCFTMLFCTYAISICDNISDPNENSACLLTNKDQIARDIFLDNFFLIYTFIFALEMVCKIIADGLILHKRSYLRNGWNFLDGFITMYSVLGVFIPNMERTAGLRVLRLLRVLNKAENLEGVRRLVSSIMFSLPTLANVLLFIAFILVMFATVGTQLFSGLYYNRCRSTPEQIIRNNITMYYSPPMIERICAIDGKGQFTCPAHLYCVNFYNIPKFFNLTQQNITIDQFDIKDEGLETDEYFFYNIPNWDSITNCLFNVFFIMTYQTWTAILSILLDGASGLITLIFFMVLVFLGGFFIMRLVLAVQNENLLKIQTQELEQKLQQKMSSFKTQDELEEFYKKMENIKNNKASDKKEQKDQENKNNNKVDNNVKVEVINLIPMVNEKNHSPSSDSIDNKTGSAGSKKSAPDSAPMLKKNNFTFSHNPNEKRKSFGGSIHSFVNSENNPINVISEENGSHSSLQIKNKFNSRKQNNESIVYSQNKNIILIENYEFEHSCKKMKEKMVEIRSNDNDNNIIDCYLKKYIDENSNNAVNTEKENFMTINRDTKNETHEEKIFFNNDENERIKNSLRTKLKKFILEEYSDTPQFFLFNLLVYSVTLVNLFYLAKQSYPTTNETFVVMQISNLICSSFFVAELIFKICVLGCRDFFHDKLNIVDLVVVTLGLMESAYFRITTDPTDDSNSSISSFKALRLIRLLTMNKLGFLRKFVSFIVISLKDLINYTFLIFFFIIIFSIAGREFFANKIIMTNNTDSFGYIYKGNLSPRESFDSLFSSFTTVFILFIGDDWPKIFFRYARIFVSTSYIYFTAIIIFGNIMLFNLFLSIMMTNYDTKDTLELLNEDTENTKIDDGKQEQKKNVLIEKIKGVFKKIIDLYFIFINCGAQENEDDEDDHEDINKSSKKIDENKSGSNTHLNPLDHSESLNRTETKIVDIEKPIESIKMIGNSLFLFNKSSKFRAWCYRVSTQSEFFEYYQLVNIILSLIILAVDTPFISNPTMKTIIWIFDLITVSAFIIEMVLKIVALGYLFNGKFSYLRHAFNVIDFTSVTLSVLYIIVSSSSQFGSSAGTGTKKTNSQSIFRVVKIMRIVRVFKLVERSKSLQATLVAFFRSLKQMLTIVVMASLFLFMFSIVGVTYFRGLFFRCDFTKVPVIYMYEVITKWDCLDYGGDWINPFPNFDNVKNSFILLVEMMTAENWTVHMWSGVDASGINLQPVMNNRQPWGVFFLLYMIFAFFLLLNLAISILAENFKKEKENIENSDFKIPIQKEFFQIYTKLYKVKLPKQNSKSEDKLTKILLNILDSIYFDVIITMCIISNLVALMMNWPGQDQRTIDFINEMTNIFNYVFIFEAALKLYVFRCAYFSIGWNVLDFCLVSNSIFTLSLGQVLTVINNFFDTSILRAVRVMRILRILKKAKSINRVFNLFLNSIHGVMNVALLYFIFLFLYSIIGMNIFGYVKSQTIISYKWNFTSFFSSVVLLMRITSGEQWSILMSECLIQRGGTTFCKYLDEMNSDELATGGIGCGTILSIPYFISFIILTNMMFLQFFSVVIVSTVKDTYVINLEELKTAQLNKFKRKWVKYDKECTGFIAIESFQKFLYGIGHPLGISSLKVSDFIKVVSLLEIYTYEDKKYLFFYDVLTELTKYHMIHKQIIEEYGEGNLFKNLEETVEEKSQLFESLNNE